MYHNLAKLLGKSLYFFFSLNHNLISFFSSFSEFKGSEEEGFTDNIPNTPDSSVPAGSRHNTTVGCHANTQPSKVKPKVITAVASARGGSRTPSPFQVTPMQMVRSIKGQCIVIFRIVRLQLKWKPQMQGYVIKQHVNCPLSDLSLCYTYQCSILYLHC